MYRKNTVLIIFSFLIIFALSACGTKAEIPSTIEQPLLQFPGTEWNMTPEEVIAALSIQDTERVENAQTLGEMHISFGVKGREFLGEEAVILFEFYNSLGVYDESKSHYGLRQVCVFYPETTDSDALIQQLNEMIGDGVVPAGKDNMIWSSTAAYSDFLPNGNNSFSLDIPAAHITLHQSFSHYSPQYLLPSDNYGENGIVLQFYANHHALLQLEPTQ